MKKQCDHCEKTKWLEQFRNRKNSDDGKDDVCIACRSKEHRTTHCMPFLHPIMQAFLRNPA